MFLFLDQVARPTEIAKEMLENFIKSKRTMFARVSGMVIDAHKDDKVDDFVHELDLTGVWLVGRREVCIMFHHSISIFYMIAYSMCLSFRLCMGR